MGVSFDERVAQRGEYPKKSDEKQLVKWISNQREAYKASKLTDARKEKLAPEAPARKRSRSESSTDG